MDRFGCTPYHEMVIHTRHFYSRVKAFNDTDDFYTKAGYCADTTKRDSFLRFVDLTRTLKFLSKRKFLRKPGNLPLC